MNILIIVGGANQPSNCDTLAHAFADGAQTVGATVNTLHLRDLHLEDFSLRCYDPEFVPEANFNTIQSAIESADGIVIASPIWNFGIPGNLKNMIDRCGAFGLDQRTRSIGQWKGKPFFIIFTGGAPASAWTGLLKKTTSALSASIRYFGGTPVETHFEPRCTTGKGTFGLVVDKRPTSLATMREKGAAFASLTKVYTETGALPLKHSVITSVLQAVQLVQKKFM